jgi:predicted ATP-grasp superfamily ATP-dependent carboligase
LNSKTGIIVIGGHIQALGIARILGRQGIPVVLLDDHFVGIARFSKYVVRSYSLKGTEAILDELLRFKQQDLYSGWIVFPTHDSHVELLSKNKHNLEPHYRISTDDWSIIELFYDKVNTYALCKELEIPLAKTYTKIDFALIDSIDIDFPCIIKPAVMHKFYSATKSKVLVCNDKEHLKAQFQKALEIIPSEEIIIQSIIKGDNANQFSACFFSIKGEIITQLSACRMRQHPIDFGNATTYAETVEMPEILEHGKKILSHSGYTGVCEIEFKRDSRDGVLKFLEVNPRTWKWHMIAERSKSPFLLSYYQHLTGQPVQKKLTFEKASFFHLLTDTPIRLLMLIRGNSAALRRIKPCQHAVWDIHDLKPWFMEKVILPYLFFTR